MAILDNSVKDTLITGTDSNDTISNRAGNVTIRAFGGNDSVMNWGGDSESLTVIEGGSGNDDIWNYATQITVNAGGGNDSLQNWGQSVELNAESGNDYIFNNAHQVTINAGSGSDFINNGASEVTINSGTGEDTINVSSEGENVILYAQGDDYDYVYGAKYNDLVKVTSGNYFTYNFEDHLVVSVDGGAVVLANGANRKLRIMDAYGNVEIINPYGAIYTQNNLSNTEFWGSDYDDTIRNSAVNVTINSGNGDDQIIINKNYDQSTYTPLYSRSLINSGEGNDRISNFDDNSTIDAGIANDSVSNTGSYVTINSGEGDDSIENNGNNATINAGTGNDTINFYNLRGYSFAYSCYNVVQYAQGDGDDVIKNIASTDLIHITRGIYTTQIDGNDVIINVGDGKLTLKDIANVRLQIMDSNGNISVINSNAALNVRNNVSNYKIEGSVNDDTLNNASTNVTIDAGMGNDRINNDGVAMTVIDGGGGNDTINNSATQVTIKGGEGNNRIYSGASQVTIQTDAGNDYIVNSDEHLQGYSQMEIYSGAGDDTISNYYASQVTIDAGEGNDSISTSGDNVSISGGTGNDTLEIRGNVTNTTLNGGEGEDIFQVNFQYFSSTSVHSAIIQDYESGNDKIVLKNASVNSSLIDGEDVILSLKSESVSDYELTLKNSIGKEITFVNSEGNANTQTFNRSNGENTSNGYESFYSIKDFEELFKDDDDNQEQTKQPYWSLEDLETFLDALNFYLPIPKVENIADVTARVSSILDSTIKIAKGEITSDALKGEALKVIGDISAIIGDVKDLKGKDSMGWALNANILESAGSWISVSGLNGVTLTDEDKQLVSEAVSATGDLGIEVVEDVIKKIAGNQGISEYELKRSGFVKKIKNLINAGLAVMMVGYEGCNQFRESIKEGLEEELPVWAVAEETFADGIMAGIYGGVHQLTRGLDDLAFKGLRWLAYKAIGQEPVLSEKTYSEWIAEFGKRIMFGSTNADDTIDIQHDNEVKYTQDGNDYIRNGFSNVKIYAGAGKDTISSYDNTTNNLISGGDNKDRIISSSDKSTIQGDNGADKIINLGSNSEVLGEEGNDVILLGTTTAHDNTIDGGPGDDVLIAVGAPDNTENPVSGNKFYGEAGNDHIYLFGAKDSTVRGGSGYDYIVLGDTYNTVIEYSKGHGKDVVVGYNETDTISFREETNYSTVASGNDITIYVGDGQIFLQGANGKALNIKQDFSKEDTTMENRITQQMQLMGDLSIVRSEGNNLVLRASASEEEINVENIQNTLTYVKDANGNTTAQVYVARAEGGEVAGNALGDSPNIFKVIVGASENKNQLIASDSGSSLFGGKTDDVLQGGKGQDAYSYSSGNDTITNYESWEEITFGGTYQNWITDGNDFVLNAAEGSLRITDAREKLIRVKNSNGSTLMNIFIANEEEVYDYSNFNDFITAIGADNQKNTLIAGSAGSVLWGGNGKTWDEMYGGTGSDEFVYKYGNGHDAIFNASYEDTVNLSDITFDQIIGSRLIPNRATFVFTDYGSLNILGQAGNFVIGGQNYNADYNNNQLQAK